MQIHVSTISPRDKYNKIHVRVTFWQKKTQFNSSATVEVFVDHTDSYAEIRKRAIEAARELFTEALATEAAETPDE
jgi:ribosomal protein L16/L10AE